VPAEHTGYDKAMDAIEPLVELLAGRTVVALVGAGCSTESGIPDYRGPETARRARDPIQHRSFVDDPESRRRYWARSAMGGASEVELAPDGDAEVEPESGSRIVGCVRCTGVLEPDVVFFGENVPRERVERARAWVDEADALLVVGSSLAVFSGLRFARRAAKADKPVANVNLGPSRGDALASNRVEGRAGEVLPALAARVT